MHSLIDTLVSAADKSKVRQAGKSGRSPLIKRPAVGGKEDIAGSPEMSIHIIHGPVDRLHLHYHACATTIRSVVTRPVDVFGKISYVNDIEAEKAPVSSLFDETFVQRRFEYGRE